MEKKFRICSNHFNFANDTQKSYEKWNHLDIQKKKLIHKVRNKTNVEFKEKAGAIDMPTTALFILDAMTGEVKEFKKGYISTF